MDGIVQKYMEGGGVGSDDEANKMDEATVHMFRYHLHGHHRTLFPLTGEPLHRACTEVVSKVQYLLAPSFPGVSADMLGYELVYTKLDRVVAKYLPIVVSATLQHPPVVFSAECGR